MADPAKQWILDRLLAPVTFGTGPVDRVLRFFAQDVWRVEPQELGLVRRRFYRLCRVLFLTARGFLGDKCLSRASALTYITALSLVPLLAFGFSVLKGLGFYQRLVDGEINPFLDRLLGPVPLPGAGTDAGLRSALDEVLRLVSSTDFKGLGAVGLLIVLWAVMRLLGSVEGAFNDIWGVRKSRSLIRKVSDYLTIVIVTPIFLVVVIGVRALIAGTFAQQLGLSALVEVVLRIAPLLGAFATFTCVYLVLPNARARFVSTLIGGCVAGALWILALLLYVQLQIGVANYNAIYAGFAVLPIFLVWVQISWVIVLLGAELAFAHEYEPDYRGMASYQALGHGALERVALRAMARIGAAFLAGDRPRSPAALAADLGISPQPVEEVLEMLVRADLLVAVAEQDTPGSEGYVLACDPSRITIKRILDALKLGEGDADVSRSRGAGDEELDRLLGRIEAEVEGSAFNLNLRDLVQRVERGRVLPGSAEVERAEIQPS